MSINFSNSELLNIKSIKNKLTREENGLRFKVMNFIINNKISYSPESEREEQELLILKNKNTIDSEKEVKSIYPVSSRETNKRVFLENSNRNAFAMCAVDALGMHFTFDESILVDSECEYSKEKIKISIKDGKMDIIFGGDKIRVLYKDLKKSNCWSCCCCNCMHFFKDSKVLRKYVEEKLSDDEYFDLSLDEAFILAENLFSDK